MIENIGKYRIDSVLGSGTMGVVYKAFDANIGRVVALKTIRSELFDESQEAELVVRFKNEAQASGRLNHPNIVTVYDFGETKGTTYIAMEFVDGAPLNTLLVSGTPMDVNASRICMLQVLRALDYAHAHGVVHRDIKPANLMITSRARLKITDFGIARIDTSTLTQLGSVVGTPSYMSPEQFRGEPVDGRTDVFSAAVILYQLLTGYRPFAGTASVVMHQILNEMPAVPSSLNPMLNKKFDAVIQRALAKRPDDRFASVRNFYFSLEEAYSEHSRGAELTDSDNEQIMLAFQRKNVPVKLNLPSRTNAAHFATQEAGSAFLTLHPEIADILPDLQIALTAQIGPMAKLLVKNALARAVDVDDLYNKLLAQVPSDRGRKQFLEQVQLLKEKLASTTSSTSVGSSEFLSKQDLTRLHSLPSHPAAQMRLAQSVLDLAESKLTPYLGPIAKVLVKRSARMTNQGSEFYRLLAENVATEKERLGFLHDVGEL